MAQTDYNLSDAQNGPQFVTDLNGTLSAIASNNGGTTAPTTLFPGMWWADTAANQMKVRNPANTAWITVGSLIDPNLGLQQKSDRLKYFARQRLASGLAVPVNWTNISPSMVTVSDPSSLFNVSKAYIPPETGWYEITVSVRLSCNTKTSTNHAYSIGTETDAKNFFFQAFPAGNGDTSLSMTFNKYITASVAQPLSVFSGSIGGTVDHADLIFRWSTLNG